MKKILLIEPNIVLAQQYKAFLTGKGYKVTVCVDAQSAIMAADKTRPDLVILELLLSGHSGIEFLYEFRSYSEWKNIPAILLSVLAPHDVNVPQGRLQQLGVSKCLYKGESTLESLGRAVSRTLNSYEPA